MRKHIWLPWAAISAMVALLPLSAAALTATDTFDYADGTDLAGSGSAGGGWGGAWYLPGGRVTFVNSAGAAVGAYSSTARENKRSFATPLSITDGDPTIWLSFDMKVDFEGTLGNSQDVVGLDGAGVYGRLNDPSGNLKWSTYPPYPYAFSTVDIPDDVWSHVCVKLQPTGDGIATYTMWVDPDYGLPEHAHDLGQVAPLLTGTMNLGNTSIPGVVMYSSYYTSANVRSTDNLRVSDETSPFAPSEGFVATEPFPYADGNLNGNGTATFGWAGAWYSAGSEASMVVDGNEAKTYVPAPGTSRSFRKLAEPMYFTNGAPAVWVSAKLKIDLFEPLGNSSDGLNLLWDGDVQWGAIGRMNEDSVNGNKKWSVWSLNGSPWYHFASEDIPDNAWSDVCVKYVATGNGTGNYTMWVDPNYNLDEDAGGQTAPVLNTVFNHNGNTKLVGIGIGGHDYDTGTTSYWDDIRVGTITPFSVPTQGTLIMVK